MLTLVNEKGRYLSSCLLVSCQTINGQTGDQTDHYISEMLTCNEIFQKTQCFQKRIKLCAHQILRFLYYWDSSFISADLTNFSGVSIVDFEQVNAGCVDSKHRLHISFLLYLNEVDMLPTRKINNYIGIYQLVFIPVFRN